MTLSSLPPSPTVLSLTQAGAEDPQPQVLARARDNTCGCTVSAPACVRLSTVGDGENELRVMRENQRVPVGDN